MNNSTSSSSLLGRGRKSLNYIYYRYTLETHLYMCEPWERTLVNSVFLALLSLILLISYLYVPSVVGELTRASVRAVPSLPDWLSIASIQMQSDDL